MAESAAAEPAGSAARGLLVGIGDDAAVLRWPAGRPLVTAADALAEGTHFTAETAPELVGRKALAVNLSDLAAMGAKPVACLLTLTLPRGFDPAWAQSFITGLRQLGERFGCPLVGGDTTSHRGGVVASVTVFGTPIGARVVTRSGARAGDRLRVSGALGGSLPSGRHLNFEPRLALSEELVRNGPPRAMMDLSDGLGLDLVRMADASQVDFEVDLARLPAHPEAAQNLAALLGDGEDFELLVALDPTTDARVAARFAARERWSAIGRLTPKGSGRWLIMEDGQRRPWPGGGWEHA